MFVVTLKFAANRAQAAMHMDGHNAWIRRGFDDGVLLLAGSIQPGAGGAVIAHKVSRADLEIRVNEDPFVAEGVVTAEILEIVPGRTDDRLSFLKA